MLPLKVLKPASVACYLTLAAAQDDSGIVGMSYGSIARKNGYARRSVIEAVKELEKHKLIERVETKNPRAPLVCKILAASCAGTNGVPRAPENYSDDVSKIKPPEPPDIWEDNTPSDQG